MSQRLTAFSGGGWHSLSALYGMTAGALDALEEKGGTRLTSLDVDVIDHHWALTTSPNAAPFQGYSAMRKAFEQLFVRRSQLSQPCQR